MSIKNEKWAEMPIRQCRHLANRVVCQFAGSLGSVTMNLSRGIDSPHGIQNPAVTQRYSIWDLGGKEDWGLGSPIESG